MVGVVEIRRILSDRVESQVGAEQIGGVGGLPGICCRAQRRVLVLPQVRRAEVHHVDGLLRAALQTAQAVVPVVAHIHDVSDHRERKRLLEACLPLPRRWDLRVVLEGDQRRHGLRGEPLSEGRKLPVAKVGCGRDRRIARG